MPAYLWKVSVNERMSQQRDHVEETEQASMHETAPISNAQSWKRLLALVASA